MSTPYHDLLADIALRVNAFEATVPDALQAAYAVRPLVNNAFDSTVAPFSAMVSALLLAEEKLATAIANTTSPALRAYLAGQTNVLSSGSAVPSTDTLGRSIIGILGAVRDSSDGTACKEHTLEEIERRLRNAGNFYRIPLYAYKFDGSRIFHTRTTVVIDVCSYNRATQKALVEGNGNMILGDDFGEAIICGAVASLVRDDEYTTQGAIYAQYFEDTLARIRAGMAPIPSKATPPDQERQRRFD